MRSRLRTMIAFLAIILGFFMALLDTTIVNIALPKMTQYYGASMQHITWVVNGYNLAFAVFIITASRIADQFGRKKVFIAGVVAFTLASILSGISSTVELLILFRVIQGLAAAVVVPVTVPLVMELVHPRRHGAVLGIWGAISGLAAASGPTLGGILTENFQWQSIFFVNVPIGILTVILTAFLIKESFDTTATRKIDWGGMISMSTAMFAVTYALIQANEKGWTSPVILGLFALSAVAFAAFVIIEFKAKDPMVPMWLMKIGPLRGGSLTLLVFGAGVMSTTFLLSFYLNQVMGKTVLQAGLIISTMPLASMLFSGIAGPLSNKFGSRWFAVLGMCLVGFSQFLFSSLTPESTELDIIWRLLVTGAGLGFTMAPVMGAAIRNVPREKSGIVSGVTNMTRALGTVLGIAILVTILNASMSSQITKAKTHAMDIIQADTILDAHLKTGMTDKIKDLKISRESQMPKSDMIMDAINKQEADALAKAPKAARDKVKAGFEAQKKEVGVIWGKMQKTISGDITGAFSTTFKAGSLMMVLGIFFAFFCDKRRSKETDEEPVKVVYEI